MGRRLGLMVGAAIALAFVLVIASMSKPPVRTVFDNPALGVRAPVPEGWHYRSGIGLLPGLDPTPLLALATFPLPERSGKCSIFPLEHLRGVGAGDALIIVYERLDYSIRFDPRPETLGPDEVRTSDTSGLCRGAPDRHWILEFEERGRGIQVYVGMGDDVRDQAEDDVWELVNAIEIRSA